MRSFRLTTALAAAATLLALAPAAALAAHRRQAITRVGVCHAHLYVAPRLVYARDSALAWGRLKCSGHEDANQPVTLYEYTVGSPPGFNPIGTTTTNAVGGYQLSTGAVANNAIFYAVVGGIRTETRTVRVVAEVALNGPTEGELPAALQTGRPNRVAFSGTVFPADEGARVILQRENALTGDEWHRIGMGLVGKEGKFTIPHAFVVPGDANIRVLVRSSHRNIASPSNELNYEISQAQNPKLTIESLSDPVAYGQPVTIHGTTTPNTVLTLTSRTVHVATFSTVTQVKSDGSGAYTFPVQLPIDSTFYQVQGSGLVSAVLFEGVKYVLTGVSQPAPIQAGQTLTFAGTVTPYRAATSSTSSARTPTGGGYHVVGGPSRRARAQRGLSITHAFFGWQAVLRIKVPATRSTRAPPAPRSRSK